MTKHIHAELMMQYAQDALETNTPWERWECTNAIKEQWIQMSSNPNWYPDIKYRRKPKTININGFEVPEPCRTQLEDGDNYYIASPTYEGLSEEYIWRNDNCDRRWLNSGLVHLTSEAAKLHAKALLSFTQSKEQHSNEDA